MFSSSHGEEYLRKATFSLHQIAPDFMKNSSMLSRRTFLTISAAVPAAMAAGVSVNPPAAEPATSEPAINRKHSIGLELYSVRGELARDLPNTLKTVAQLGYEVV